MSTVIDVPAGGAWFEGHFPDRPILPGVAQIALVLDALARETGHAPVLRGIAFTRLRQLVLPGERLELVTRASAAGHLRFDLKRGAVLVANGELIIGTPPNAPEATVSSRAASNQIADAPSLDDLLPHRPPMRFLTAVLSEAAEGLTGIARIPGQCALVCGGSAAPVAAIEAAAQAAAAWEALRRRREARRAGPRIGYLVAMRDVTFFTDQVPADRDLLISVNLEAIAQPLTHYHIEIALDGRPVARGTIATYLSGDPA